MDSNNFKFELFEYRHIEEVRKIYNHYVKHTSVSFDIEEASSEKIEHMFIHDNASFCSYVLLHEDSVIGYVSLSPFIKKHGSIHTAEVSVYLQPAASGQGLGSHLLNFIEQKAEQFQFHTLIAVVCTENSASTKLFERAGYKLQGILTEVAYKFDRYLNAAYYQKHL